MTDTTSETETQNEDVSGLKANNADLKTRLSKEQTKVRDLETRLTALEQDRDDAIDSTKTEADKATTKLQREIDKLKGANTTLETRLSTLLIDNTINEAIAKNGVLPHFADAVTAMLKLGAKMENGEATVDGEPLADKVSAFFSSEKARHYVAAPDNSGGGAQGSSVKASGWTKPPETADEWDRWMKETTTNPVLTNSLADSWGRPELKV